MPEETPTKKAIELQAEGKSNTEIIQTLQGQGYSFQQISEALNQAQAKASVEPQVQPPQQEMAQESQPVEQNPSEMKPSVIYSEKLNSETDIPVPTPGSSPAPATESFEGTYQPQAWPESQPMNFNSTSLGATSEDIEEIAESIINEKWQKLTEDLGDIMSWKEKINNDLDAIKQEVMRVENRFENLQNSVIGKVREYDQSVGEVGVEIKALGKLLSNIINPLTSNVKELQGIVKNLKD